MNTRIALFVTCVCAAFAGCSGKAQQAEVTGEVTLDGVPVEVGSILFVPANPAEKTAGGGILNGKYRLVGAQAPTEGEYKVEIRSPRNRTRQPPTPGKIDAPVEAVAARFNTKTELKADIQKSGGVHDFNVQAK